MAINKEQKGEFNDKLKDFKAFLEDLKKETNLYKVQIKKKPNLGPFYYVALAMNSIKYINTCLLINELSLHILTLKSENYLNLGRKEIYEAISTLEKVVGSDYDGGLGENKEMIEKIKELSALQRLNLIKGLKNVIDKMIEAYGAGSKWKWSWPEIHFKLAILGKNFFDFYTFEEESDISHPNYYIKLEHYNLMIELCNFAAQEYRAKFDLSTSDVADLKKCLNILELIRKIYQITGNNDDIDRTKILIESLKEKVESIEAEKNKDKSKVKK